MTPVRPDPSKVDRLIWTPDTIPTCHKFPCAAAVYDVSLPDDSRGGLHVFKCNAGHRTIYHDPEAQPLAPGPMCYHCALPLATEKPVPTKYHTACEPRYKQFRVTCVRCGGPKPRSKGLYDNECRKLVAREQRLERQRKLFKKGIK